MSSVINPIKWVLYNSIIPRDRLPIIETSSDSAAFGTVAIAIPAITSVINVSCSVYYSLPPTTEVDNWTRLAPDLYTSDVVNYSYAIDSDNQLIITWEFDPSASPLSSYNLNGAFFSMEFSVNPDPSATVPQIKTNSIIKIVNQIDDTGVTGYMGITGLDSVHRGPTGCGGVTGLPGGTGLMGITGSIGITGPSGYGGAGLTGLQGETGSVGITGYPGITGISSVGSTGPQGMTGVIGLTGVGITGLQGVTGVQGSQGATGVQGTQGNTGVQGSQGNTGVVGNTGVQGTQGVTGIIGATGIRGITGQTGFTGLGGITGLANILDQSSWTLSNSVPVFMWNQQAEAWFSQMGSETGAWIQISAGTQQGAIGLPGPTGLQGVRGFTGSQGLTGGNGTYQQPRSGGDTSTSTPTPNANTQDMYYLSALAVSATFQTPSGTPVDGQKIMIRIKDNGTSRALGWNSSYKVVGIIAPTATVPTKATYVGIIYNAASGYWNMIAQGVES